VVLTGSKNNRKNGGHILKKKWGTGKKGGPEKTGLHQLGGVDCEWTTPPLLTKDWGHQPEKDFLHTNGRKDRGKKTQKKGASSSYAEIKTRSPSTRTVTE